MSAKGSNPPPEGSRPPPPPPPPKRVFTDRNPYSWGLKPPKEYPSMPTVVDGLEEPGRPPIHSRLDRIDAKLGVIMVKLDQLTSIEHSTMHGFRLRLTR